MSRQQVRGYYSEMREKEWRRLVRDPYHRLEFDTSIHFFKKYPKGWKNWQELHLRTCTHPSIVDNSQHFMIICRK